MNSEPTPTPREQTEMRLTALLMGELSAEETVALHAQIAADSELAKFHARLRQAMELLREATAESEPATPTPARLSSERRERLLAHFKSPAPQPTKPSPIVKVPRRNWSWVVPMGAAAAVVVILAGLALPVFSRVGMHSMEHRITMASTRAREGDASDDLNGVHLPLDTDPVYAESRKKRAQIANARNSVAGQFRGEDEIRAGTGIKAPFGSTGSPVTLTGGTINAPSAPLTLAGKGSLAITETSVVAGGDLKKSGTIALYLPPTTDAPSSGDAPQIQLPGATIAKAGDGTQTLNFRDRDAPVAREAGQPSNSNLSRPGRIGGVGFGMGMAVAPRNATPDLPPTTDAPPSGEPASEPQAIPLAGLGRLSAVAPARGERATESAVEASKKSHWGKLPPKPGEDLDSDQAKALTAAPARPAESSKPDATAVPVLGDIPLTGNLFTNSAGALHPSDATEFQRYPGDSKAGEQIVPGAANTYHGVTAINGGGLSLDRLDVDGVKSAPVPDLAKHEASALKAGLQPHDDRERFGAGKDERRAQNREATKDNFNDKSDKGGYVYLPTPEDAAPSPAAPAPPVTGFNGSVHFGSTIATPSPADPATPAVPSGGDDMGREVAKETLTAEKENRIEIMREFALRHLPEPPQARAMLDEKQLEINGEHVEIAKNNPKAPRDGSYFLWTDDETTKLNLDTKSDGTVWDEAEGRHRPANKGDGDKVQQIARAELREEKKELAELAKGLAEPLGEADEKRDLKRAKDSSPLATKPPPPPAPEVALPKQPTVTMKQLLEKRESVIQPREPEELHKKIDEMKKLDPDGLDENGRLAGKGREAQQNATMALSDSLQELRSEVKTEKAWNNPVRHFNMPPDTSAPAKTQLQAAAKMAVESREREEAASADRRVVKLKDEIAKVPKLATEQPMEKLAEESRKLDEELPAARPAQPAAIPQPEVATSANAFSTFSLNVSDVSFKLAGASLEKGRMPEPATVRSEEFINAFDYRDPEPAAGAPLAFSTERARYPFAQNRDLVRFSVKTAAAGRQPGRPLNIVLLLDNSGSMERADRVRIIREALRVLAAQLQPQDKLSVVTFARTPRLWADGMTGDKAAEAVARVGEITPQGGTNLDAALDLGYATALKHYQSGSITRVVMLTDGAANLGDVNPDALQRKVETNRQRGVALDCFGIGWEGYDDTLLETLARHGDGRYGFINTPEEAASGFAAQLAGALRVAAADVKVQVEWNPRRVTTYRQIGYAKHQLKKEQFRDNTVDAAEIGAAESGNALYVVEVNPRGEGDLATVRVRFKVPGTEDYREHEWTVPYTKDAPPLEQASPALRLAGTASAFSEWLVASPYAADVTPDRLLGLLNGVPANYPADPRPKKLEWMIRTAKSVSGR